jgi:DegV family protein with EDD domain
MKIVTDSACDMPADELRSLGIEQAPLFIHFPEGQVSSIDLSPDEFYDRLGAMHPAIPSTAQPSAGLFAEMYERIARTDRDIMSIHISSGLSGTINSARVGAEHVGDAANVTLWDTLTLASAERFQVIAAALAVKAGWASQAIQQRLADIRAQSEIVFTLDTVEYLARGGRIGRVAGLAGMLLNIKPVIHVAHHDGKYTTLAKSRTLPKSVTAITDYLCTTYGNTPLWVAVQHGRLAEKAESLAEQLSARLNIARLDMLRVSPVLGVHTGPAIVGAAAAPMSLFADLDIASVA